MNHPAAIEHAAGTPSEAFLPVLQNGVTTEFYHVEALKKAGAPVLGWGAFITEILPHEKVSRSLGPNSGLKGLLIGTAFGAIQVPADGQPIILGPDRPVTGGDAKIATVISADFPLVAQARPGSALRFRSVSLAEALEARGRMARP